MGTKTIFAVVAVLCVGQVALARSSAGRSSSALGIFTGVENILAAVNTTINEIDENVENGVSGAVAKVVNITLSYKLAMESRIVAAISEYNATNATVQNCTSDDGASLKTELETLRNDSASCVAERVAALEEDEDEALEALTEKLDALETATTQAKEACEAKSTTAQQNKCAVKKGKVLLKEAGTLMSKASASMSALMTQVEELIPLCAAKLIGESASEIGELVSDIVSCIAEA